MEKPTLTILTYPAIELRPVIGPEHAVLMIAESDAYRWRWHMTELSALALIKQFQAAHQGDIIIEFGEEFVCVVTQVVAQLIVAHIQAMLDKRKECIERGILPGLDPEKGLPRDDVKPDVEAAT